MCNTDTDPNTGKNRSSTIFRYCCEFRYSSLGWALRGLTDLWRLTGVRTTDYILLLNLNVRGHWQIRSDKLLNLLFNFLITEILPRRTFSWISFFYRVDEHLTSQLQIWLMGRFLHSLLYRKLPKRFRYSSFRYSVNKKPRRRPFFRYYSEFRYSGFRYSSRYLYFCSV